MNITTNDERPISEMIMALFTGPKRNKWALAEMIVGRHPYVLPDYTFIATRSTHRGTYTFNMSFYRLSKGRVLHADADCLIDLTVTRDGTAKTNALRVWTNGQVSETDALSQIKSGLVMERLSNV